MANQPSPQDWFVQVPLRDLLTLQAQAHGETDAMREVAQLRREVEGLRNMLNETLSIIGEIRREVKRG